MTTNLFFKKTDPKSPFIVQQIVSSMVKQQMTFETIKISKGRIYSKSSVEQLISGGLC